VNRIKLIRMERRIRARSLAKRVGITPSYVCLIENGRRPSKRVRARISKVLCLPSRDLWPDVRQ